MIIYIYIYSRVNEYYITSSKRVTCSSAEFNVVSVEVVFDVWITGDNVGYRRDVDREKVIGERIDPPWTPCVSGQALDILLPILLRILY